MLARRLFFISCDSVNTSQQTSWHSSSGTSTMHYSLMVQVSTTGLTRNCLPGLMPGAGGRLGREAPKARSNIGSTSWNVGSPSTTRQSWPTTTFRPCLPPASKWYTTHQESPISIKMPSIFEHDALLQTTKGFSQFSFPVVYRLITGIPHCVLPSDQ